MLGENKNLKNSIKDISSVPVPYEAESFRSMSYTKTNKLITALYMVTDIMDKEEPLRNKLRTLGINIISDTRSISSLLNEVLSLLDIASAIGMISEMNCNILKKEFFELKKSIQESITQNNPMWLEKFLEDSGVDKFPPLPKGYSSRGESNSVGHNKQANLPTGQAGSRLGVQKGSTLLKALSNVGGLKVPSNVEGMKVSNSSARNATHSVAGGFDLLKKQRRELISKIIKDKPSGMSIKDIGFALRSFGGECGEKTLQRELASMVYNGVLEKNGEKRWSRYFLKK